MIIIEAILFVIDLAITYFLAVVIAMIWAARNIVELIRRDKNEKKK